MKGLEKLVLDGVAEFDREAEDVGVCDRVTEGTEGVAEDLAERRSRNRRSS